MSFFHYIGIWLGLERHHLNGLLSNNMHGSVGAFFMLLVRVFALHWTIERVMFMLTRPASARGLACRFMSQTVEAKFHFCDDWRIRRASLILWQETGEWESRTTDRVAESWTGEIAALIGAMASCDFQVESG